VRAAAARFKNGSLPSGGFAGGEIDLDRSVRGVPPFPRVGARMRFSASSSIRV